MQNKELTLEERFKWLENNPPKNYKNSFGFTWEQTAKGIKQDMYAYCFNHPYYIGIVTNTDDEERHKLLDELEIPRYAK